MNSASGTSFPPATPPESITERSPRARHTGTSVSRRGTPDTRLGLRARSIATALEAALDHIAELGLEAVEHGTGGWPGNVHCDPAGLLADAAKLRAFQKALAGRGLVISALSCHGNPLHPKRSVAKAYHDTFVTTVKLAR